MVRFWKITSVLVLIAMLLTIVMPTSASQVASAANTPKSTNGGMNVYFFYGDGCPHCAVVEPLIENLSAKYPQVHFIKLEVWYNNSNKALFLDFLSRYEIKSSAVPAVFIADQALTPEGPIQTNLESDIQRIISSNNTIDPLKYSAAEAAALKNVRPEIKFITANDTVFNSSNVSIHWNYTSGQSNVVAAKVAIDGGAFNSIARDAESYVASGLSNGNHAFVLRITNGNGSSSDHKLNFTVDLESRSVARSAPSSSLPIGFAVLILIVGLSLVLVQRTKRKG